MPFDRIKSVISWFEFSLARKKSTKDKKRGSKEAERERKKGNIHYYLPGDLLLEVQLDPLCQYVGLVGHGR